ncbi:MAG TPA: N-acetyl-gamma-glutamyl-phosphate reductase [Chitinophagales bacterium]|jgi:N-acetyl-gamma-glutamyl-phosphate reductase|nr:N-acetyl-gamma-glutamyl-phosphate reductase [Chitinophagales bacterium]HQV78995.1 N-acetyl-gamma-glutamyl-phosphate reductase [Chitinophagales bacterium]HQW79963.1 N-acetyl-gamma-glutamyl-phosphate reductase [Chitinophagales bacterium]HRB67911.1 N-acetyl-gamma-glutamyl-phosphate reductase [Chitinophagales bacterium]
MDNKIKAGIIGAAGYTGGELMRILLQHPKVEMVCCYSRSQQGKPISDVHSDLVGESDLYFTNEIPKDIDVLFLCLPHGEAKPFLETNSFPSTTKIIDLSNDFRLKKNADKFVYGLPELNKNDIKLAQFVANTGCFATTIQYALLPLAHAQLLKNDIHISGITGSTGAGVGLSETAHFSWRTNNISVYKAFTHQHLGEITESIQQLQPTFNSEINFIPYRGNFSRGILITAYIQFEKTIDDAKQLFSDFYKDAPFVILSNKNIHLKQVVNTNKCLIYIEKIGNKLMIIAATDNLVKGASGQAVQNMNLMFGFDEEEGLKLKPVAY